MCSSTLLGIVSVMSGFWGEGLEDIMYDPCVLVLKNGIVELDDGLELVQKESHQRLPSRTTTPMSRNPVSPLSTRYTKRPSLYPCLYSMSSRILLPFCLLPPFFVPQGRERQTLRFTLIWSLQQ